MSKTWTRTSMFLIFLAMRYLLLIICLALLTGCVDQDPFGLRTRDVASPYELEQWEDGTTYYLLGPSHIDGGWGALEGTVVKLGWNENFILAWQKDDGQGAGWRIIDVKHQKVSELVDQKRIDEDPVLSRLSIYDADVAWEKLK